MVRYWTRLTLLQRFTLASAVIAVGLAVLLSAVTVRAIESFAIKDEAQVAAEILLRTISSQLQPSDFAGTLPPKRKAFFDALFRAHGISDRSLRIRLWRADGRLLYSNVQEPETPATAGADLSTPNGFAVFLENRERIENATRGVVRFFVPVVVAGDPKPLAAFEIFYDLTHLQQQLRHVRLTVWTLVPLGMLALYTSVFVLVRRASRQILRQHADLTVAYLGTFQSLASAIDAKDSYTGDHSTNVARLAAQLAETLGLAAAEVEEVRMCARLHDIGKISVPDAILMKPGSLDPQQLAIMRTHVERGYEILRSAPLSDSVKLGVLHSHERWDGKGYPRGLAADGISVIARIVAVVDAYEAMTSTRPYRMALPTKYALQRLEQGAGSQFDPNVVRVFVQLIGEDEERKAPHPPASALPV